MGAQPNMPATAQGAVAGDRVQGTIRLVHDTQISTCSDTSYTRKMYTCIRHAWHLLTIGAVIGDATPGGRGADVTGVVVSQEGLDAHKLL